MFKATWMALLIIGVLLSAAGFADDAKTSGTDGEQLPVVTLSVETLLAKSEHAARWQLFQPVEAMTYSDDWPRPIADFDFQDDSALARLGKLRGMSLLTLAEIGQTRLFLGVNEEGLVGLHFSALPRNGDERYQELIRMPYLKENDLDKEAKAMGPDSN